MPTFRHLPMPSIIGQLGIGRDRVCQAVAFFNVGRW